MHASNRPAIVIRELRKRYREEGKDGGEQRRFKEGGGRGVGRTGRYAYK